MAPINDTTTAETKHELDTSGDVSMPNDETFVPYQTPFAKDVGASERDGAKENAAHAWQSKPLSQRWGLIPPANESQSGFLHSERNAHIPGSRRGSHYSP
jgi:hypothetical protein